MSTEGLPLFSLPFLEAAVAHPHEATPPWSLAKPLLNFLKTVSRRALFRDQGSLTIGRGFYRVNWLTRLARFKAHPLKLSSVGHGA